MNIPKACKAVIFDFDGLIIDSEPYWYQADIQLLGKRHIALTPDIKAMIYGSGQQEGMRIYKDVFSLTDSVASLVLERRALLYGLLMPNLIFMQGALEAIIRIHGLGLPLALATGGHSDEKIAQLLEKLGINGYFSVCVSGENIKKNKPHPDIFLAAAAKLGVLPESCLVLEDSPNGVLAARDAGMSVYAINQDPDLYAQLVKNGAKRVYKSFVELF
jgi:beta-phosphoglucomutase-like phosphatase (HAD superfamily)